MGDELRPAWDRYFPVLLIGMLCMNAALIWRVDPWYVDAAMVFHGAAILFVAYVQIQEIRKRPESYPEVWRNA